MSETGRPEPQPRRPELSFATKVVLWAVGGCVVTLVAMGIYVAVVAGDESGDSLVAQRVELVDRGLRSHPDRSQLVGRSRLACGPADAYAVTVRRYDFAGSVGDALAFYREQLTDRGWKIVGEGSTQSLSATREFGTWRADLAIISRPGGYTVRAGVRCTGDA